MPERTVDILTAGANHRGEFALREPHADPHPARDSLAVPVCKAQKLACDPARNVQEGEVGQLLVLSPDGSDQRGEHPEAQLWCRQQCGMEVVLGEHDAARWFDRDRARCANSRRVEHPELAESVSSAKEPKHELPAVT